MFRLHWVPFSARTRTAVIVLVCLVLGACGGGGPRTEALAFRDGERHTPLEDRLDLSSPEAAIATLSDAYADRDFIRSWFVFDEPAQRLFYRALNNINFREIRRASLLVPDNLRAGSGEHSPMMDLEMLARIFEDAARDGYLHVDFANARVVEVTADSDVGAGVADQIATVELRDRSEVRVLLTRSPSARWRVKQVAIDGAEFDADGGVFVDQSCGEYRIEVHDGSACPSSAGSGTADSDEATCAAIQGERVVRGEPSEDFLRRAEQLMDDVCPGDVDRIVSSVDGTLIVPEISASGDYSGSETVYTMLELSNPEQSVETFIELFQNRSFFVIQLALAPEAQRLLARPSIEFAFDNTAGPGAAVTSEELDSFENLPVPMVLVSEVLNRASDADVHLIDLSTAGPVVGARQVTWSESDETMDAQLVEARWGESGSLYFVAVEAPSGRWRIRHVSPDPNTHELATAHEVVFAP